MLRVAEAELGSRVIASTSAEPSRTGSSIGSPS